ncbi:zinc finger, C3HC4 type (RING finger) domain-containing protein [Besnoitia besnoiti]|uniref:RING-type E3 ubiquitin transferase n=1 Tax=Besnoitia besnoiti TaxID=94643 RepID=A0A2A9M8Q0_BESBE|nr:zinc finger, C3HC4 type (RING finger) domain-containing protein [Besnoitia besnoiti]PFH32007.1 zinc finger, C3HC4 type (RING finger) domain-containing protein [Besnoitia besnoiti]
MEASKGTASTKSGLSAPAEARAPASPSNAGREQQESSPEPGAFFVKDLQPLRKRVLEKLHVLPVGHKAADRVVLATLKTLMADGVFLRQYMAFEVPVAEADASSSKEEQDGEAVPAQEGELPQVDGGRVRSSPASCTYIVVDCCPKSGYIDADSLIFLAGQPLQPLRRVQLLALVHPNSSYARRAGIHSYQQLFDQAPSFPSVDRQEPCIEDFVHACSLSPSRRASAGEGEPSGASSRLLSPFTPAYYDSPRRSADEEFFGFTDIIDDLESISSSTSTSDEEAGGGLASARGEEKGPVDSGSCKGVPRGLPARRRATVPHAASRGDTMMGSGEEPREASGGRLHAGNARCASGERGRPAERRNAQATDARPASPGSSADSGFRPTESGGSHSTAASSAGDCPEPDSGGSCSSVGAGVTPEAGPQGPGAQSISRPARDRRTLESVAERRRRHRQLFQQHSRFFESESSPLSCRSLGRVPNAIRVRLRERAAGVDPSSGERSSGVYRAGKRLEKLDGETLFREFVGPYLRSRMHRSMDGRNTCESASTVVLYPGKKLVIGDLTFVVWATDPRNNPGFVDKNTSVYISLDPFGEFKRVHFVPFSDTLPTTYRFDFYEDYLKPFLLENTWRNFTRGDVYSYRGVEFKLIATEPSSCTIARVGPETIVYYQGTVEPSIMDLIPPDTLQRIRRLPVRLQPFAIISAAQTLDPQVLMRVIPAASIRGSRQGINEQMTDVLREKLVHPFSFVDYLRAFPDLCEHRTASVTPNADDSAPTEQADPTRAADLCSDSGAKLQAKAAASRQDDAAAASASSGPPSEATEGGRGGSEEKREVAAVAGGSEVSAAADLPQAAGRKTATEARRGSGEGEMREIYGGGSGSVLSDGSRPVTATAGGDAERPRSSDSQPSLCVEAFERPSCTVCTLTLEEGDLSIVLPCGHVFHWQCAHAWLRCNSTCPNCRADINVLLQPGNGHRGESLRHSRIQRSASDFLPRDRQDDGRNGWPRRNTEGDQDNRTRGIGNAVRGWFRSILS